MPYEWTGFEVGILDEGEGKRCHWMRRKKKNGRWANVPCDEPAWLTLRLQRNDKKPAVEHLDVPLCRRCMASLTGELVGMLGLSDPF